LRDELATLVAAEQAAELVPNRGRVQRHFGRAGLLQPPAQPWGGLGALAAEGLDASPNDGFEKPSPFSVLPRHEAPQKLEKKTWSPSVITNTCKRTRLWCRTSARVRNS